MKNIILQRESGALDIRASQHEYLRQGKPRRRMLKELFIKVGAVLPNENAEYIKNQVRLAANAIFAESRERPIQPRKKGLRIKSH